MSETKIEWVIQQHSFVGPSHREAWCWVDESKWSDEDKALMEFWRLGISFKPSRFCDDRRLIKRMIAAVSEKVVWELSEFLSKVLAEIAAEKIRAQRGKALGNDDCTGRCASWDLACPPKGNEISPDGHSFTCATCEGHVCVSCQREPVEDALLLCGDCGLRSTSEDLNRRLE